MANEFPTYLAIATAFVKCKNKYYNLSYLYQAQVRLCLPNESSRTQAKNREKYFKEDCLPFKYVVTRLEMIEEKIYD
jgi:hypothetical protein